MCVCVCVCACVSVSVQIKNSYVHGHYSTESLVLIQFNISWLSFCFGCFVSLAQKMAIAIPTARERACVLREGGGSYPAQQRQVGYYIFPKKHSPNIHFVCMYVCMYACMYLCMYVGM